MHFLLYFYTKFVHMLCFFISNSLRTTHFLLISSVNLCLSLYDMKPMVGWKYIYHTVDFGHKSFVFMPMIPIEQKSCSVIHRLQHLRSLAPRVVVSLLGLIDRRRRHTFHGFYQERQVGSMTLISLIRIVRTKYKFS